MTYVAFKLHAASLTIGCIYLIFVVIVASDRSFVRDLVAEVLAGQSGRTISDRVQVVTADPGLTLDVDRGLLAMIIEQYIDNARKYSAPGTAIEIAIRKSRAEVLISVHDFGSTIRTEGRERVFDRLYRSDDSKESVPGTGVGLSVVRRAAEAHHGYV
jgi:K+-sensing histidine kinase KdpD